MICRRLWYVEMGWIDWIFVCPVNIVLLILLKLKKLVEKNY